MSRVAALQCWLGLGTRRSLRWGNRGTGASGAHGFLPSRLILGMPCSRSEMGTPLQQVLCEPASESGRDGCCVNSPCLDHRILLAMQAAANEFSRSVGQEASPKTSPKRDGFQEEVRHTRGFAPGSLQPTGLVRHPRGSGSGA